MKRTVRVCLLLLAAAGSTLTFGMIRLEGVPSADFDEALRNSPRFTIEEVGTTDLQDMPMIVSLRFVHSKRARFETADGGLGFPDRTQVYSIRSNAGVLDMKAHVREGDVCYVSVEGAADPGEIRNWLENRFPGLATD